ncbi:MAG: radical SAM protein [Blastocatellia bacterium]|nr:radical SAM protein [Blastocatellia bacterium]
MSLQNTERFRQSRKLRLAGIAAGQVLTGPQTVHIDLANGCNTNCTTCWDHSPLLREARPASWKRKQFDFADFLDLANDLATMNSVEAVILSGMGDPFVNPDIYRMIATCKDFGWHVTTLTNALLANPEQILALDVDMMLISVNGVSPASYMAFHPNLTPRDFAKLGSLLERFAQAGKRFKHVQVINRDTAGELVEMVRFADRYRAQSITYKLASLGHGTEACAISETQRQRLSEELIPAARSLASELGVTTNLDVFEAQVRTGGLATAPISEIGCFMGWYYARVTVEGKILFCCSTEVEVGHLASGLFSEQWFGAAWNQTRAQLMAGQYFPGCNQCGKLNQNVKIGQKIKDRFGLETYLTRTGR